MGFTIKIVENDKKIKTLITKSLVKELNIGLKKTASSLIRPIRVLVGVGLRRQPEYYSLDNSLLAASFGLPDGKNRIDEIIDMWLNNITVRSTRITSVSDKFSGGINIGIVDSSYSDVLAMQASSVTTEKGEALPWLEWLLKFGDQKIILDYDIFFNPVGRSRSGLAVMIQRAGSAWGVPSQFAGTEDNNFVTRGLQTIESDLLRVIERTLKTTVRI